MRILNRPMFRYGGPIREGLMHGMRNNYAGGQRVGLYNVGSPGQFPKTNGREHHALPAIWAGAAGLARLAPTLYRAITGAGNVGRNLSTTYRVGSLGGAGGSGWSTIPRSNVGKEIMTVPQAATGGRKVLNTIKDWFKRDPLYTTVAGGTTALGRGLKWTGKKAWGAGKYATTTPSGLLFFGAPVTIMGGKWLLPDGTELNKDQKKQVKQVPQEGPPGGGDPGMRGTGEWFEAEAQKKLAAEAKAARKAKLEKYLDTMGYDKAKKTAMGDALIDASAIVQGATDEAGSLKKADWGRMINQAIQATSKRLDKPEQIREAVGLMMTKADIEKDLKADTEAQDKLYKNLAIQKLQKELEGNTFRENLVAVSKTMQGQDAINTAVQLTEGKDFRGSIIDTTDFNKILKEAKKKTGVDDITVIEDYTQKVIDANPDKFEDGHYTVGNNLVTVKDKTVIAVE